MEIRTELDPAGPVSVQITGTDGGAPRTVRDETVGAMHVVHLSGLSAATHYSYFAQDGSTVAKGEFTTAPPPDSRDPFTVLVYGDNRSDEVGHAAIVRAILQSPSDCIINTGDLVQDGSVESDWQSFFDIEAPLLRSRSVFSCVGNHELRDGAERRLPPLFRPHLRMPAAPTRSRSSMARSAGGTRASSSSTRWRRSTTAPSARGWRASSPGPTPRRGSLGGSSSCITARGRRDLMAATRARSARASPRSSRAITSI